MRCSFHCKKEKLFESHSLLSMYVMQRETVRISDRWPNITGIGLGSPVSLERGGIARRRSGTLFACMVRTFALYLLCLGTPYQWGATVCTLVTYALLQLMGLQRKNVSPTGNGHRSWCLLWHLRTAGTSVCSVKGDCKPPSSMRGFMTKYRFRYK